VIGRVAFLTRTKGFGAHARASVRPLDHATARSASGESTAGDRSQPQFSTLARRGREGMPTHRRGKRRKNPVCCFPCASQRDLLGSRGELQVAQTIDINGAPEEIRTPDPQIRRRDRRSEYIRESCKLGGFAPKRTQWVRAGDANRFDLLPVFGSDGRVARANASRTPVFEHFTS